MAIHIGQKVKEILEKRGISKSELSRRLNMTSTNIHKIFKRETIDTGLLEKISIALDHDFFQYFVFSNVLNDRIEAYNIKSSDKDKTLAPILHNLEQVKKELETIKLDFAQKEVNYLKKINELLPKTKTRKPQR